MLAFSERTRFRGFKNRAKLLASIDEIILWRHHLHRNPELAYAEFETSNFIAAKLEAFGLQVHRGLAGTGVVGTLTKGTGKRSIGIRADMDALPIFEKTGVSYASEIDGKMHACGHDGHMAMVLGAASECVDLEGLDGTVHFIFQPAEENEGGGRRMVEDGLFDLFPCDEIFSLHNWPSSPLGTYVIRPGAMMAAFAIFEIKVEGRGAHGATPHQGNDVLLASSHIHTALQSIVSRSLSPQKSGVVSVTAINGGSTWNVLPESCTLRGTTRWLDDVVGDLIELRIIEIANSIAESFGCSADIRYDRHIPVTSNDERCVDVVKRAADRLGPALMRVDEEPSMISEDFAFMLNARPGAYLFLGTGMGSDDPGLHSPFFNFNDAAIPLGISFWTKLVRERLGVSR
ncbi:M20 aminoacylase family protein [Phyllobacterium ifriqiyense]|uniref:M20 aminoacylase family protein n=1 Tax=Phyllobacterium ifriqiyense TaxID=314238 RepID=UPI003392879D